MDGWKIDKLTLMAILGSKKCWSKSVPIFPLFSLFFLILQEVAKNAFFSENLCKYLEISRSKAKKRQKKWYTRREFFGIFPLFA